MRDVKSRGRGSKGVALKDVLWQLLPAIILTAVFAGVGVMHVASRVRVVDSGYRLSVLESARQKLQLDNDQLKLELATLKNPSHLEKVAREQHGLLPPPPGSVLTVGGPALTRAGRANPFGHANPFVPSAVEGQSAPAHVVAERLE